MFKTSLLLNFCLYVYYEMLHCGYFRLRKADMQFSLRFACIKIYFHYNALQEAYISLELFFSNKHPRKRYTLVDEGLSKFEARDGLPTFFFSFNTT